MSILSFDRYLELFADEFEFENGILTRETRLVADLGFDSLEFLRAAILLDLSLALDHRDADQLERLTVGELYDLYVIGFVDSDLGS